MKYHVSLCKPLSFLPLSVALLSHPWWISIVYSPKSACLIFQLPLSLFTEYQCRAVLADMLFHFIGRTLTLVPYWMTLSIQFSWGVLLFYLMLPSSLRLIVVSVCVCLRVRACLRARNWMCVCECECLMWLVLAACSPRTCSSLSWIPVLMCLPWLP